MAQVRGTQVGAATPAASGVLAAFDKTFINVLALFLHNQSYANQAAAAAALVPVGRYYYQIDAARLFRVAAHGPFVVEDIGALNQAALDAAVLLAETAADDAEIALATVNALAIDITMPPQIVDAGGARTLGAADAGAQIYFTAGNVVVTLPEDVAAAIPNNSLFYPARDGAADVSFIAENSNVLIESFEGRRRIGGDNVMVLVVKRGPAHYAIYGLLAP